LVGKHYSLLFLPEDFVEVSRQSVLPRFQGKKTGLDLSPKLFDERRSAPRNTKNLEVKIRTKSTQESTSSWVEIHSSGNYARGNSIKVEKNRDNKAVWVEIASIGQYDKSHQDQFVGTVGIIRDISEKKEGEKKFHLLFSRHASIILIIDPLNRAQILDANQAALRFYGCSKEELLSKSLFDLIEGNKEEVLTRLENALKGNVDALQISQVLCDGTKKSVELSTSPVQIKQKNCLFCVIQDISGKKEALDALEESRTYIEEFMQSTPDMIFLGDIKTGNLLYANSAALSNTGYSLEEITCMNHLDLHPKEKHAQYSRFFSDFGKKGEFHPHEILLLTKKKEVILCEISGGTFTQQKRKIAFVVFRDIRERKAIEQRMKEQRDALRKSNYQLEQFAYAASHDLREPLRMVQSFLGILKDQYQDNLDETAHEYIHYAQEGAKRMDLLIAELLNFSRLSYQDAVLQEISLETVVKHALENLKVLLDESGAVIALPFLEYKLEGDPSRLMRLFQNLVENAVKFCDKAHAQIEILVENKDEELTVHIKDNGIGIGPEFFGRIFKIFQRLHPRHVYKGTGIGLAVCQKIVEQHGGKIWVDSQLGQGSTFSFTLKKKHAAAQD
jgi:PAS domain S-box-containing protein